MAKKPKKTEPVPREFSKETVQSGLDIAASEYFANVLALLSHRPENGEFTYTKVPLTTPDGGLYLLSILHIEGPKINLQELAKMAEAQESENKKG